MFEKLSHTQAVQLLQTSAYAMRALSSENQELREKVAHNELEKRCSAIAKKMGSKGIQNELSEEEKVAALMQRPDKLDAIEEAVGMAVDQGGILHAGLEEQSKTAEASGAGEHLFKTFILAGDG